MLLSLIVLLLLAGVAYYHYVQGIFTAAISAGCALIALLVAFGYYEVLAAKMGTGRMGDYAPGMLLAALFGLTYIALRVLFDAVVPGNIRLPLIADRIGAAVFGVIAGAMAAGVFAVTAQLLPFGASIGGHQRLAVQTRDSGLRITKAAAGPDARTDLDLAVRDELVPETFDAGSPSPLLVPVDQFVVSLASMASSGAFQGSASLPDIHPDLLTDAFGLRIGPEPSAARIIVSTPEHKSLTLESLFLVNNWPGLVALDSEIQSIRENQKSLTFKDAGKPLLIARVRFENKAGDGDGHVRLTPGAIRLVVDGKVYHPIGFMTSSGTLALVRADDLMAIPLKGDITAGDFVFAVDSTVVNALGKKGSAGTPPFLEFKMLGRIPLAGVPVADKWVAGIDSKVLVKAYSPAAAGKPATPVGAPAAPGTPEPAPAPAPAP